MRTCPEKWGRMVALPLGNIVTLCKSTVKCYKCCKILWSFPKVISTNSLSKDDISPISFIVSCVATAIWFPSLCTTEITSLKTDALQIETCSFLEHLNKVLCTDCSFYCCILELSQWGWHTLKLWIFMANLNDKAIFSLDHYHIMKNIELTSLLVTR
jgi:hypothetical protein